MCILRFLLTLLFPIVLVFNAKSQSFDDTLARFYQYNHELRIEKIEREHVPLHGDSVDMIPFREGPLYGFIDKSSGKWLIRPMYTEVFAVYPEGGIVKGERGYGLVNKSGKAIIPLQFHNLVKEGNIYQGSIFGIIDTSIKNEYYNTSILSMFFDLSGNFLFSEKAHDFSSFKNKDSLAWFRYGTRYRIRAKSGDIISKFNFNSDTSFIDICNNLLIFQFNNKVLSYQARDGQGKVKFFLPLNERADGIYQLSDHLFGYYLQDGDYFFCDEFGLSKPYGLVSNSVGFFHFNGDYFQAEYFVVRDLENDQYGLINRQGDTVLPFRFRHLIQTGKNTYLADNNHFINAKGDTLLFLSPETVTETLQLKITIGHEIALPSSHFLVLSPWKQSKLKGVKNQVITNDDEDDGTYQFINMKGNVLLTLPESTQFASDFYEGLALIMDSSKRFGFIDSTGKLRIPFEFELSMAGAYPFPYMVVPSFQGGYAYIKSHKGYIDRNGKKYFTGKRMQDHYNFSH